MRREAILFFGLPLANAFSLANFQDISSSKIPSACLVPYYSQIPICTQSDFTNGCSSACAKALEGVAQSVDRVCSTVDADPKSLLAIVMNGGILAAICPSPKVAPSSEKSSHAATTSSASAAPTTSRSVQTTTTTDSQTSSDPPTTTPTAAPTTSAILSLPAPDESSTTQPSSTDVAPDQTSSSSATTAAPTETPGSSKSGEVPIHLSENTGGAESIHSGSVMALVIAACACVLLA